MHATPSARSPSHSPRPSTPRPTPARSPRTSPASLPHSCALWTITPERQLAHLRRCLSRPTPTAAVPRSRFSSSASRSLGPTPPSESHLSCPSPTFLPVGPRPRSRTPMVRGRGRGPNRPPTRVPIEKLQRHAGSGIRDPGSGPGVNPHRNALTLRVAGRGRRRAARRPADRRGRVPATLHGCSSMRPDTSARSTPTWPARRTSRHSAMAISEPSTARQAVTASTGPRQSSCRECRFRHRDDASGHGRTQSGRRRRARGQARSASWQGWSSETSFPGSHDSAAATPSTMMHRTTNAASSGQTQRR